MINKELIYEKSAAVHNAVYRGKDITDLFYNGTLSKQIAAGTFDDIFVGDYITGKESKRKYLVAHIDYYLNSGNTECTKHHLVLIPERIMGTAKMNSTNTTEGAYVGSEMYKTNLAAYKTIIQNDFETAHLLTHRALFANAVTNGYESAGTWYDSLVDLMTEGMVYGSEHFHNVLNGINFPYGYTSEFQQLALFKLDKTKIVARNNNGVRYWYWLRDVASGSGFCNVTNDGACSYTNASNSCGVRPAFLVI